MKSGHSIYFGTILIYLLAFLLFLPTLASAFEITLLWDPNREPDIAGYRVFCREEGKPYEYSNPIWEGAETTCTISDLNTAARYFFVVRAFDILGNVSSDSNEAIYEPMPSYELFFSMDLDRSNSLHLHGQTVTGDIYVFVSPDTGLEQVSFFVDGVQVSESPDQVEITTPYDDPIGAALDGMANALDTTTLHNGVHEITAILVLEVGPTRTIQATFAVDNQAIPTVIELSVTGLDAVNEYENTQYNAMATFSDGAIVDVTAAASWSTNSPYATINTPGLLETTAVPMNQTVILTAQYRFDDIDWVASMNAVILDDGVDNDKDGDGMPDWWEVDFGLNLDIDDADYDLDADDLLNLDEYESHTNPNKRDTDNDGFRDGLEVYYGLDPNDLDSKPDIPFFEVAEVDVTDKWNEIYFQNLFLNPVVVATPLSNNGCAPAVVRIRSVSAGSFDVRSQEWGYLDGVHKVESVGFLVMESGSYIFADGTRVEAGRFETDKTNDFGFVAFDRPFDVVPVVAATICSYNEEDTVIGRVRNVNRQGFEFTMQEQELNYQHHAMEVISYIAWEPSSGAMGTLRFEVNRTENAVTDLPYPIRFGDAFPSVPVFIADMQTADGENTANLRWQNKNEYGIDVVIDEEKSMDHETRHTTETVGYMVFSDAFSFPTYLELTEK